MSDASSMIRGTGLIKQYESGIVSRRRTYAVNGVDISIQRGETYVLVGESGSGKTTLGRVLLLLIQPTEGDIIYNGVSITHKNHSELIPFRRKMQLIPQHPEDAFNPRWKVSRSILEPYRLHPESFHLQSKEELLTDLLQQTGLDPEYVNRYPHQLSGGELQRAAIARVIALKPEFIVCDEPTSMLDVSVQASIVHVLKEIQKKDGVGLLFITHDIQLAMVVGDRIGVMYKGLIVEEGSDILKSPLHPYTQALTKSFLSEGKPDEAHYESGCQWRSVCPQTDDLCHTMPTLQAYGPLKIRCHHPARYCNIR
nr:ABC transporter ATP-binding protein [uncultured Methanospirillum sp.]